MEEVPAPRFKREVTYGGSGQALLQAGPRRDSFNGKNRGQEMAREASGGVRETCVFPALPLGGLCDWTTY